MESLQELFRIGCSPSSSHTMAPRRAAELFRQRSPDANRFRVTLYGSLAATAAAQLMGGMIRQIEYAAEMGLEHHLGLTCDPVDGLVQIPCIERNVFAATRALSVANYDCFSDGSHRVSFYEVVEVMRQTGHDLPSLYRETAFGGLAKAYRFPPQNNDAHIDQPDLDAIPSKETNLTENNIATHSAQDIKFP